MDNWNSIAQDVQNFLSNTKSNVDLIMAKINKEYENSSPNKETKLLLNKLWAIDAACQNWDDIKCEINRGENPCKKVQFNGNDFIKLENSLRKKFVEATNLA